MTEQMKELTDPTLSKLPAQPSNAVAQRRAIRWILSLVLPISLITILLEGSIYLQTGIWQMLVAIIGVGLSFVGQLGSLYLYRRQQLNRAAYTMLISFIVGYLLSGLVFSGAASLLVLGGGLVVFLVGTLCLPDQRRRWLPGLSLFVISLSLIEHFEPLPRYNLLQAGPLALYVPVITLVLLAFFLWQVGRIYSAGKLRTRLLIAFSTMVSLTAAVTTIGSLTIGYQDGRERVLTQLNTVVAMKEIEIEAWLEDIETDLRILLTQETLSRDMELLLETPESDRYYTQLRSDLQEVVDIVEGFNALILLDQAGWAVLASNPALEGTSHADQPYFIQGRREPFIQPPAFSSTANDVVFYVSLPVRNLADQVIGVLAVQISGERLNELMTAQIDMGQTGEIYLVSADDVLLTGSPLSGFRPGQTLVRTVGIGAAFARQGGSGVYENYRGEPVVGVFHWLPELQVALIAEQSSAEAFSPSQATLVTSLGIAGGAVVIAMLVSLLVTRSFVQPLAELVETTGQIAAGKLDMRLQIRRADEIGDLANAFNQMAAQIQDLFNNLEYRVADRTKELETIVAYLQTTNAISRRMTEISTLEELLTYVVNRVQEEFTLYHTQIYLIDQKTEELVMAKGFGEVGAQLKTRDHRLGAGQGIVGTVASTNEPFLSNNVDDLLNFVRNPLLPKTQSELAVPLRKASKVLGVLDIQCAVTGRFSETDLAMMQSLANQVATAIENVRLLEEMQTAVQEVERLNRRLTREGWEESLTEAGPTAYRFIGDDRRQVVPDPQAWLSPMKEAAAKKSLIMTGGNHQTPATEIAVPLMLRGEVIGVMGVRRTERTAWSEEEVAAVEAVANQTSLALESARLSQEQEKTIVKLRSVDRLKSEFLTSMSHELRTPLNSIIGFADILLQGIDGPLNEQATTDITAIHNSGKHLLALINDILDLSKIEAGRMELACSPLSIDHTFNDVAASVSSLLTKKPVDLKIALSDEMPAIWADSLRLRQILINLVSNAIKFTEEGFVTMKAELLDEQNMLQISVSDTGIGIPEDKFNLVFEHFRQVDARTNRKYQGTGMGLAIARQLAELHGGRMWLDSTLGQGTTFYFTIPLAGNVQPIAE